jgi:signal recognition particle subunit SRP54
VLDATIKEISAALLEADVNVKLVASLRQKVKAKVKASLESTADKSKEINKKNLIQKVKSSSGKSKVSYLSNLSSGSIR